MQLVHTVQSIIWKGMDLLKSAMVRVRQQSRLIQAAAITSVGVGCLCLMKVYQYRQYNSKEFEINANSAPKRVVVITGCSSGIGKATAFRLNALGFIVVATCRRRESVEEFLADKSFTKNRSTAFQLDVSDSGSIAQAKKDIQSFLAKHEFCLWSIINNAAVSPIVPFEFQTQQVLREQLDTNLYGPIGVCHAFVPLLYGRTAAVPKSNTVLPANGGRIINMSSVLANLSVPFMTVYGATKAALSRLSDGLRVELSPRFGIWSAAFELGAFATRCTDDTVQMKLFNELMKEAENREEIKSFYRLDAEREIREKYWDNVHVYQDLDPVINDIIHCLTAKYPKRVYSTGAATAQFLATLTKESETIERMILHKELKSYYEA